MADPLLSYDEFSRVDVRVGTVLAVDAFPQARKPAWKLTLDFGPTIGIKRSSAQITQLYAADDLVGSQVVAVVNFPPKQIGPFLSEVLVLGVPDKDGHIVLLRPASVVPNGSPMS